MDSYRIVSTNDILTIEKSVKAIEDLCKVLNSPEILSIHKKLSGRYEETSLPFKSKGICKALKKCLVSHRFVDASKLLECLSCENGKSQIMFKAGFQALENHPNMTPERMLIFVRHAIYLSCVYKSEVALEAVIYFIKHRRFLEAQELLKEIEVAKWQSIARTDPLISGLLAAYDGLLNYVEWARLEADYTCGDINAKEQNMTKCSDKAIALFLKLLSQPGPWDIFIVKLIEILEYYSRLSEAEEALNQYKETNPFHIHAHIYLYEFYRKHNYEKEMQIQCLLKIIEICPSDSRTVDYVLIAKGDKKEECIVMLFNYLNFASNKNDLRAWNILVELLTDILERLSRKELQSLNKVWQQYSSFWPAYQFSTYSIKISDKHTATLTVLKTIVLYILEDVQADHPFLCEVLKRLDLSQYSHLKSSLTLTLSDLKKLKSKLYMKRCR